MKVVKYVLTAKIDYDGKEIEIKRSFRHRKNIFEFLKNADSNLKGALSEYAKQNKVKSTDLPLNEFITCGEVEEEQGIMRAECKGKEKVSMKIEVQTQKIKKKKKEESKEEKKGQKKEEKQEESKS
ncbi:hypothetical protein SUSAZ_05800 [Sulfolobus acidocaldarius SUSAZ]|nr:hypothetical protein SUSAZ_05800 [Sulfolobus acidocaldarius SUSAZ]